MSIFRNFEVFRFLKKLKTSENAEQNFFSKMDFGERNFFSKMDFGENAEQNFSKMPVFVIYVKKKRLFKNIRIQEQEIWISSSMRKR